METLTVEDVVEMALDRVFTTLIEIPATSEVSTFSGISAPRPGATAAWHPLCTHYVPERRPLPIRAHPS